MLDIIILIISIILALILAIPITNLMFYTIWPKEQEETEKKD